MNPTDIAFVSIIGALIASNAAVMVTLVVYLGGRIDRLGDRVGALEVAQTRLEGRMDRLEAALREHAGMHARLAHGQ